MTSPDNSPLNDLEVAVCHGNYLGRGGGERVAEAIARTFEAPLYYGFGDLEHEPDDIETHSLFNDMRGAGVIKRIYQLRDLYYMYGWRSVPDLDDYDVIIQSGNEPSWYKPRDDQVIVKYTHSPPRNAYDRYPDRAPDRGLLYEAYTFATEQLYESVLSYPDLYVANSEVVQRRIHKYWRSSCDARVVYPPVETSRLGHEHADAAPFDDPFYLVLDRLEPTKHVDDIITAFRDHPEKRLVVAGTGSEESNLKQQASDLNNISFLGYVPESEKRALLAGAEALMYGAEDEDFGIVPVEALASGTPVIGPREGFTQYQIADGQTGLLYDRGDGPLADALAAFDESGVSASPPDLEVVAEQYSVSRFERDLREAVETALDRARIAPDIATPPADPTSPTTRDVATTDGGRRWD